MLRHGSAELVELAEAALAGTPPPHAAIAAALAGLFDQPGGERVDVIVNACTHFPLLESTMSAVARQVRFVDGGPGIARRVAFLTDGQEWPDTPPPPRLVFTRVGDRQRAIAAALTTQGFAAPEIL